MLLVYVDDIILTDSSQSLHNSFICKLQTTFAVKDIGLLDYFLGIQATFTDHGLLLSQTKYIQDLLLQLNLQHIKPAPTPMITGKQLSQFDGNPMPDPQIYHSIIGSLQYLQHTRPDIAFVVNKLSQFNQQPIYLQWRALKRLLRYLQGTSHLGLFVSPTQTFSLIG